MFYYAAKVVWAVAQPSSLIVLLLVLAAVLSRRRPGFSRGLLIGGVAGLVICGPVAGALFLPLENRFARPDISQGGPITGIIILGGESAERMIEGVVLAHRFPNARVVFSGGAGSLLDVEPPESIESGRLLEALGVPKDRLTLEGASRTTYENALFSKSILNPNPQQRWLLITSAWHMPRAMGCFRKVEFPVEPWPVEYLASGRSVVSRLTVGIAAGLKMTNVVVKEYFGLFVYYLSGRSSELLPAMTRAR
jgi:uncharacterized SAM-binding protein YcdF (DUF218 family)